jgi:predicted esterase
MNEHVVARLDASDIAFVAPAAADGSWYPNSFLAPLNDNQPGLGFTLERLEVLVDELITEGIPAERIVWCGFSQGACVASQFLADNPKRWGGLIAFTGGLIGPPGTQWRVNGNFVDMPAYFSTSEADPYVPENRVRDSATFFAAAGAVVSVELHLGREHVISDAEIDRAKFLLS